LNFRELIARFSSGEISEQEKSLFKSILINDDTIAIDLCKHDVPELISFMCSDADLSQKDCVVKYSHVLPLFKGMPIEKYIEIYFLPNQDNVVTLLDISSLKKISSILDKRSEYIKKLKSEKKHIVEQQKKYSEKAEKDKKTSNTDNKKGLNRMQELKKKASDLDADISWFELIWKDALSALDLLSAAEKTYKESRDHRLESMFADKELASKADSALQDILR